MKINANIAAAVLGVVGLGLLGLGFVAGPSKAPEQKVEQVTYPVVVASRPIPFGQPITSDMLVVEKLSISPEGAFTDPKEIIGRNPIAPISAGSPVLKNAFEVTGVSGQVREGFRAIAVRVDDTAAQVGRIRPGDVVDVFSLFRKDDRDIGTTQSRLVLARLRVIANSIAMVGQTETPGRDPNAQNNATRAVLLEVPVEDVNAIALAQQQGLLMLALRNPEDNEVPSRDAFPSQDPLLKKKAVPGQTAPTYTMTDKAYGGAGIGAVAAGAVKPQTTPAPSTPNAGGANAEEKIRATVEVIRKGVAKQEGAQ